MLGLGALVALAAPAFFLPPASAASAHTLRVVWFGAVIIACAMQIGLHPIPPRDVEDLVSRAEVPEGSLARDLTHADRSGQLRLAFQPVCTADLSQVLGWEALLRWDHPIHGEILPDQIIPLAERIGAIDRIGFWVVREACRTAVHWPEGQTISVNISPLQLRDPDLPGRIAATLRETGLAPERLQLELTESPELEDVPAARLMLNRLKTLGITLALDDFGAGHAGLSYLRELRFDRLKIDGAFVASAAANLSAARLLASMIRLGHALGLEVIAEGVETEEQRAMLWELGCDGLQGHLIGRPGHGPAAWNPPARVRL